MDVLELIQELGTFGIGILLAVSVAGLFWKLDDAIAEAPRQALSSFLQRVRIEPPYPNVPIIVSAAFDRIFGKKHLSWRCFFMSCLFSFLAVAMLSVVYFRAGPQRLVYLPDLVFVAITLNLVPDYFSLMETRFVVKLMGRTLKFLPILGYLVLDFLLTLLIFLVLGLLLLTMGRLFLGLSSAEDFGRIYAGGISEVLSKDALTLSGGISGLPGVVLYSTFFTSVWVWLTALGWGSIRLMAMAPPLLQAMQYLLPIKERPLRSIGEVAAMIACLGYWGISAVTWITSTSEAQAALGN